MTHDFSGAVRAVEATLVRDLGLAPLPLPAALARLDGTWRDRPVVLAARAYAGPEVRFARFVEVRGGELEIGNIMVLAAPALALPILGVDLIDVGRDRAVVVADLSPVTADVAERAAQHDVVRARRAGQPALAAGGDLPPWATPWFSPAAVLARVEPG